MVRKLSAALLAAACVMMGNPPAAEAKTSLKLATLAPPRSPWGKVFKIWSKAVDKKTNGEVEVVWLWNGTAGPERAVVGKIKSGQITGGAITATGLSDIYKPILALQIPGAFESWAQLDKMREMLKPEVQKAMAAAGFYMGDFGDVGVGHMMSRGFPVKVPNDIKGKHPGMVREDIIGPKIWEVIGGVSPVPASVTELLPKLNSGAIDVLNAPALAAEQLQWTSRLDHMNTYQTYFGMGATVMSDSELQKLSPEHREIIKSTGKQASKMLSERIRNEDAAAFERLKKKMTVHEPTAAEKAEWKKVFRQACERLKSSLPGDVLKKVGAC